MISFDNILVEMQSEAVMQVDCCTDGVLMPIWILGVASLLLSGGIITRC